MARDLPAGRVTFAFTDAVGSTRAFTEFGDAFVAAQRQMHETIAATTAEHGGWVVNTEGDGAFLAFATARAAVDALTELQERFEAQAQAQAQAQAATDSPASPVIRIRAGAHTGEARPIGDDYVSLVVHHAARVAATAGAGQLIVSDIVQRELDSPRGERLGSFDLKDVPEPVILWRVVGDSTPPRAVPTRRTNVAAARTSFVGREGEAEEAARLLAEPGVVTVTGPGGLGKSRLVSEVVHATANRWAGGAWLAELASVDSPEHLTEAIASAVGVEAGSVEALAGELRHRGELLLALDGCDHLLDAVAEACAELVEQCAGLRVVCTSREPLDLGGERVLRLRPLATGPASGTDESGAAERLFLDRATAAGASLSPTNLPAVSAICRQLDGLPLAIELAAARSAEMPIPELADALQAGELELRRRSGHRHQRNLRDLVLWSVDRLSAADRSALAALSVFPGRFDSDAARELLAPVAGARSTAVPELVRRSLVDLDGDRYRLLRVIRDVAHAELCSVPAAAEAAHRALVGWALNGCPPIGERLRTGSDDFDTALAVAAAMRWGLDAGEAGLHPLMRRLRTWSQHTGGSAGVRDLALEVLERPAPDTADEVILQAMAAEVVAGVGWAAPAATLEPQVRELVRTAHDTGDARAVYEASSTAAMVLSKCGATADALEVANEALQLTEREPTLRAWHGIELGNLALLHYVAGHLGEAETYMRRALAAHEQDGDLPNAAVNRCNLAELLLDRGAADAAEEQARAALRVADGVRTPTVVAMALIVEALAARGAPGQARALAREVVPSLTQLAASDPSMTAQLERLQGVVARL